MPDGVARGVVVRFCDLDPRPDELAALAALLSEEDRARAGRRATPELRRRATASLGARRRLAGEVLGVPGAEVELVVGADGRRFAAARGEELAMSVSSAGRVGVVAIGRGVARLGVDVEADHGLPPGAGFVRRVASDDERLVLDGLGPEDRAAALLRLWTRKEAYLKATGEGIGAGMARVTVPLDERCWARAWDPGRDGSTWFCYGLEAPPGLHAALVVCATTAPPIDVGR